MHCVHGICGVSSQVEGNIIMSLVGTIRAIGLVEACFLFLVHPHFSKGIRVYG
jgi:hypothetical protein